MRRSYVTIEPITNAFRTADISLELCELSESKDKKVWPLTTDAEIAVLKRNETPKLFLVLKRNSKGRSQMEETTDT